MNRTDEAGWIGEVQGRIRRKNQVLFSKDSPYLQDLTDLLRQQEHRVTVLWALDFAEESVKKLKETYPQENRPQEALDAARAWAQGTIKMRQAQKSILSCHALAKEISSREDIAICHAIGQACAVVHTAGHAIGYPIYDLTALIHRYGIENAVQAVGERKRAYMERLLFWREHLQEYQGKWAAFMLRSAAAGK